MAKNFVQSGKTRTWTNGTGGNVSAGSVVVVGQQLGIALVDIPAGESGEVAFEGSYVVPKVEDAVIKHGEMVIWDASASAFDDNQATPQTGDVSGAAVAAEDAGAGVTEMTIQLANRIGTVTA